MTLQDYISLVTNSLSNYSDSKTSIAISIVAGLLIFLLGLVVASLLRRVWIEIAKFLNLEKSLSGIDTYSDLVKTSKNLSVTELLGSLIWWTIVLIFLVPALKALGLNQVDAVLGQLLNYVPAVITASLYLLIGSLFAWYAHLLILGVASLTKISAAAAIARLVSFVILVFSGLLAIKALGVNEETLRLIVMASIASTALAFGLAGKDTASDILKRSKDLVK